MTFWPEPSLCCGIRPLRLKTRGFPVPGQPDQVLKWMQGGACFREGNVPAQPRTTSLFR